LFETIEPIKIGLQTKNICNFYIWCYF